MIKKIQNAEKAYGLGKHRWRPDLIYTCEIVERDGFVDGEGVVFYVKYNNYYYNWRGMNRIHFEFEGGWYYFDNESIASKIRNNTADLNFNSVEVKERAPRVRANIKYRELWGSRTIELIADSKRVTGETNDCTVRATMEALRIPYDEAHELLERECGRQHRKGIRMAWMFQASEKIMSLLEDVRLPRNMTVATFATQYSKGRYVVGVTGHAFAVVDGKIIDHKLGARRKVQDVFKVREGN